VRKRCFPGRTAIILPVRSRIVSERSFPRISTFGPDALFLLPVLSRKAASQLEDVLFEFTEIARKVIHPVLLNHLSRSRNSPWNDHVCGVSKKKAMDFSIAMQSLFIFKCAPLGGSRIRSQPFRRAEPKRGNSANPF
jgi:hypothetical protein